MLGVLPETLERLLGENFLSSDMDGSSLLEELAPEVIGNEPYCRWCNPDDESESDA